MLQLYSEFYISLRTSPVSTLSNVSEGCLAGKYSVVFHFQNHTSAIQEEKTAPALIFTTDLKN